MSVSKDKAHVAERLITDDPGIPRDNPTAAYWQHITHALAETRSHVMPSQVDMVVIGSGITGASVTKALLEATNPSTRIVVLEARTLCSGATGRNGGQLATNAGEAYAEMKARFGKDQAGKIADFTFRTCDRMRQIVEQYAPEEGEYQHVTKVRSFLDDESLASLRDSVGQMEEDHPHLRGIYERLEGEVIGEEHGLRGSRGGVSLPAGVLWPYRVVTNVFADLLSKYGDEGRLSIETKTPVTSISFGEDDGKYIVNTPRGIVRATKVIHCTNGYLGHLIPNIRGLIFPVRGTMTVQDLGGYHHKTPSQEKGKKKKNPSSSYAFHYTPKYNPEDKTLADGLWYLTQNSKSGYYFFGGEKGTMEQTLNADDSVITEVSRGHLRDVLPKLLGKEGVEGGGGGDKKSEDENKNKNIMKSAWSGIMGFVHDGVPLVGKLPESATGRIGGEGEFAAAGFNGYGMPYCWLAGEQLAKMIVTDDKVDDWFPESFLVSGQRLERSHVGEVAGLIASLQM